MRSLMVLLLCLTLLHATTIRGEIYNGDDFQPLTNTLITIETVNGTVLIQELFNERYQLNVTPGTYTLRAYHYVGGSLEYYTEHPFQAVGEGMQFDLVLLPYELQVLLPEPPPSPPPSNQTIPPSPEPPPSVDYGFLYLALLGILLFYLLYRYLNSSKKAPSAPEKTEKEREPEESPASPIPESQKYSEPAEPRESYELDEDSKRVLKILQEQEGRMYQKELRQILNFSETKMSLLLTELETQGLIKRFKKGRDNLLKLIQKDKPQIP